MSQRKKWLEKRQQDPNAQTVLVMAAAQHPLEEGVRPGPEFQRRLEAALDIGQAIEKGPDGFKVDYAVAGHRHRHEDENGNVHTDKVALHDAAAKWYVDKGVEVARLHGPDWYGPNELIYNGADELDVLARGVAATRAKGGFRYRSGLYVCSPGQESRAQSYANKSQLMGEAIAPEGWVVMSSDFHAKPVKQFALHALSYVDPGNRLLRWVSERDRMPDDNFGPSTVPELIQGYVDLGLAWHQPQPPQEAGGALPNPSPLPA